MSRKSIEIYLKINGEKTMERRFPLEVAYLVFGALFGLVVGIPCNLWASTYIEIIVNGRTELWGLMVFWTLGVIGIAIMLYAYGVWIVRRGRDAQQDLALLRNQVKEMKKQIENKIEKILETKEKK